MANGNPPRQPGNNPNQAGQGEPRPERGLKSLREVDVDSLAAEARLEYPTARAILEYVKANPTAEGLDSLIAGLGIPDEVRDRLIGKYRLAVDPRVPATVGMPIRPGAVEAARATEAQKKGWFQGIKRTLGAVIEPMSPVNKGKRGYLFGSLLGAVTYTGTLAAPFGLPVKIGTEVGAYLISAGINAYYKKRIKGAKNEQERISYETKRRHGFAPLVRDICAGYAAASVIRAVPALASHGLAELGTVLQSMPVEGAELAQKGSEWIANSPLVRSTTAMSINSINVQTGMEHGPASMWAEWQANADVTIGPEASGAAVSGWPEIAGVLPGDTVNTVGELLQRVNAAGIDSQEGLITARRLILSNADLLGVTGEEGIKTQLSELINVTGTDPSRIDLSTQPDVLRSEINDVLREMKEYQAAAQASQMWVTRTPK